MRKRQFNFPARSGTRRPSVNRSLFHPFIFFFFEREKYRREKHPPVHLARWSEQRMLLSLSFVVLLSSLLRSLFGVLFLVGIFFFCDSMIQCA